MSVCILSLLSGCADNAKVTTQTTSSNDASINETSSDSNINSTSHVISLDKYLDSHSIELSVSESKLENLDFIDTSNSSIFLTAEEHGIAANAELKMEFTKYFKKQVNFKYLLSESPISYAYVINQYLESGDEEILRNIYKNLKGINNWNKQNYNYWLELYAFNSTLPEEERIEVIGVDVEHQPYIAYQCLIELLPDSEVPHSIEPAISELKDTFKILTSRSRLTNPIIESSNMILDSISENEECFEQYLGSNFVTFKLINQNVINKGTIDLVSNDYKQWYNYRDKMMFDNFRILKPKSDESTFFGQLGMNHTFQSKQDDIQWFASYLDSEQSEYNNKVLTIAYNYVNCSKTSRGHGDSYTEHVFNRVYPFIDKYYSKMYPKDASNQVLYEIGTPDKREFTNMIDLRNDNVDDIDVSECIQYVLLIDGSKATEPLND